MKKIFPFVLVLIIVGAGAFYGGILYAKSKNSARNNFMRDGAANFANLSMEERQARMGQMGGAGESAPQRGPFGGGGGGFVSGEIISKDDKSVTIKLNDGGSKIIFFSNSTKITKTVDGASGDLKIGESIAAGGSANSDGSVTATTIQLRPALPVPVKK